MSLRYTNTAFMLFLAEHVHKPGCWLWRRGVDKDGYGRTAYRGHTAIAHRAAYQILAGDIPTGAYLCHRCDMPACVNPRHLFVGDAASNHADSRSKDRHSRGMRNGCAKLTDSEVRAIRKDKRTQIEIARTYGVYQGVISAIKLRQTWKHLK